MLRTGRLTGAAAETVGRAAARAGVDAVIIVGVPVVQDLLAVHRGEQIRNGDLLRTAVRAVAAGRAGDEIHAVEDLLHLMDGIHLVLVQRAEIAHERYIFLHLRERAHAGEHHLHVREAGCEADGIARGAAAVERIEHRLRPLRQVDEVATLDRLHDEDGLAVLDTDLVAFAALHGGIFIVEIVELELDGLDVRIFGQDLFEDLCAVVEGDADVADLPLGLERKSRLIGAVRLEILKDLRALRVHQIIVEIVHAAGRQLLLEHGADVRLGVEEVFRQLVRQQKALARIAAGETVAERQLALALQIAVRRVKIVEARVQKRIHHAAGLRRVHFLSLHRQAHKTEAEFSLELFHRKPSCVLIATV